ncbi:MAG TPA: alpha/beta fold hydrolase, partial [Paraburkholderia sp.]
PKLAPDSHGLIWLPADAFPAAFAQDATPQELALLAAVQRPIAVACIGEKVARPLWKDRPSWYLVAAEDRMISPATQHFMADRMGAEVHVAEVDHAPIITAADTVTNVIVEAVQAVSTR